jgi:hypothetical protein
MLNTPAYSLSSSRDFEPTQSRRPGALVVSLDFELHWGVRDHTSLDRNERARLLSARCAVQEILSAFQEFSIHATWASVGFLFARSRAELESFTPLHKPTYLDPRLDPYRESIGRDESDDPFHFAPSLIAQIQAQPGQEIATHSFSHYYCMEPGQGAREFESDLDCAVAIAASSGYSIDSYVFPRNQVHASYLKILAGRGISSYRGTQASPSNASASFRSQQRPLKRLRRLCDAYVDLEGSQTIQWPLGEDLISVGGSRYLRPHNKILSSLEDLQYRRISNGMNSAAATGELFHLWWHPEDFALHRGHNLRFLRKVLSCYEQCQRRYGMLSLSMKEVARLARPGSSGSLNKIQ